MPKNDDMQASCLAIKRYLNEIKGKFTTRDILASYPGINRQHVRKVLIRLTELGDIIRFGTGSGTYYIKR